MLHRPRSSVVGWAGWTAAEHFKLAEQRREETVAANEAASAGNAGAVRAERLMSEHDQQLQIVREDHAQEVSHLQHLAAAAQRSTDDHDDHALYRNKLRIPLGRVRTS